MNTLPAFIPFPKLPRLSRGCVITEKIDGTNAQVFITEDGGFFCGSRTRWITPEDDNFGFARWAHEHKDELMKLGPGQHFGEWWGAGIQRNYGLTEKRFSLFNATRWMKAENNRPACCHVVPLLGAGLFTDQFIAEKMAELISSGSVAAPGFMQPEGIVIYHTASGNLFKKTIDKDDGPKSKAA